jgi:hypothetical protein
MIAVDSEIIFPSISFNFQFQDNEISNKYYIHSLQRASYLL